MTPFAALALYPLWALTLAVGLTAARLARRTGWGLLLLCLAQGGWVAGLVLLESGAASWAERLLPSGMLLAGAFVHAAVDVAGVKDRRPVKVAWLASFAVALLGLLAPRALYGPGAHGAGPLFWPVAVLSLAGTAAVKLWLLRLVRSAEGRHERRRRIALLLANVFGALGGGGAIALHITGLAPAGVAAPFLLASILTVAWAVLASETGRDRDLLRQGLVLALVTSAISSVALLGFFALLPTLVPGGDVFSAWGMLVVFLAALPLEPLRALVLDRVLASLFRRPIAVRALATEAEVQADRAEHSERLAELGRIAGGVAHEVRNPLGIILAEVKLLERSGADAESLEAIRAQVARAGRFVDDLLRFAKPAPLDLHEVDVTAAAREAAQHAARSMEGSLDRVTFPSEPQQGPWVEADRTVLSDVLRNLLSNALIATEGRGDGQVKVSVEALAAHIQVVVEDNGPGVPPALEPRLFEAFATGRGRDATHPGTGLGLAISARLAKRHGATIVHERPANGGARFVVRWPKTPTAEAP